MCASPLPVEQVEEAPWWGVVLLLFGVAAMGVYLITMFILGLRLSAWVFDGGTLQSCVNWAVLALLARMLEDDIAKTAKRRKWVAS